MERIHQLLPLRYLLPLLLFIFLHSDSNAFGPGPDGTTVTVSVQGLTPAMRDGIARDLAERKDLKLVYACVPAGILVFESSSQREIEGHAAITSLLERRVARQRIMFERLERGTVEQRCAEIRNQ